MLFKNRSDAGRQLAAALQPLSLQEGIVIGLPRGGVVIAAEIARILNLPLDIIIPRKIGAPFNNELAIGALVEDTVLLNDDLISAYRIDPAYVQREIAKEKIEAARRLALYRQGKPPKILKNKTVIVVDDGIATGATMRASLKYLKLNHPKRLIIAIPVAPQESVQQLKNEGFEIVCLYTPASFFAVGQFYEDFPQTTDEEVIQLMEKLWK
jgi:predicted phosphoribosyltransferase